MTTEATEQTFADEQQEAYKKAKLNACPHCSKEGVEYQGGYPESEGGESWFRTTCPECGKSWNEVYSFSHIEPCE